jgi:hypothetical protein
LVPTLFGARLVTAYAAPLIETNSAVQATSMAGDGRRNVR